MKIYYIMAFIGAAGKKKKRTHFHSIEDWQSRVTFVGLLRLEPSPK